MKILLQPGLSLLRDNFVDLKRNHEETTNFSLNDQVIMINRFVIFLMITMQVFHSEVLFGHMVIFQEPDAVVIESSLIQIDNLDTVIFDYSSSVITSTYIDIPVKIHSDDVVNALDFSFKFNHNVLTYDTTIELTSYMISNSYYNPVDSTVRYTSYSMTNYVLDTPLVMVRLMLNNGTINFTDLFEFLVYLNGDPCSVGFNGQLPTKIENIEVEDKFKVYPNPCYESLYIKSEMPMFYQLHNIQGQAVSQLHTTNADVIAEISTRNLPKGIYILKIFIDGKMKEKTIMVGR